MGGKKKTKWRKLPLEEFTKEIQTNNEKVPPEKERQQDPTCEESIYNPALNDTAENTQYYTEPYECIDGLYYPTSCVIYNPGDIGMYPNYMMPLDNYYYYYTVPPELSQMQEYVPMPYQEYGPPLPKDTVYLLLPTQSLRPSQAVSNVAPDWQSRRRRRRYEGYADYAIIPEKTSSTNVEEKDNKRASHYASSRRNSSQSSNFKKMNFSETCKFGDHTSVSDRNQRQCSEVKRDSIPFSNSNFLTKEMDSGTQNNHTRKKSLEVCGIHTKSTAEKKESSKTKESNSITSVSKYELDTLRAEKSFNKEGSSDVSQLSQNSNVRDVSPDNHFEVENKDGGRTHEVQSDKFSERFLLLKADVPKSTASDQNFKIEMEQKYETNEKSLHLPVDTIVTNRINTEEDKHESPTQSQLSDILSTLNKPSVNSNIKDIDDVSNSALFNKGISPKAKSYLSQTSYLPNLLSSEALHNEMELELKQLQNLHSLQANQSIYKLAFDENLTDQSEVDSRSPSPIDPESQIPSSLINSEILIHEADSGSEAGSEDVELIPHRYESETFLNESKYMYVNKLSLAVELLRTQETLPYDDEFKRVVGENNKIVPVHTRGKTNLGFMDDSSSPNALSIMNNIENKDAATSRNLNEVITKGQMKHSAHSSDDSAIVSDIEFDNLDEESCESAKEVETQDNETQENTERIQAQYRRFGVQARYFLPRTALPLNPCFCCIIM